MYEKRLIDSILKEYVDELPAILLEGAKAVGKTETCKQLASTEYRMDNAAQRELLQNNPEIILQNSKPVLIDEWQLAPSLWSYVRHAVDDGLPNGSVLFTGSSIRVNSRVHSGAGRIIRLKLRPYSIEERNLSDSYIRIEDLFNFDSKATVNGETDKTLVDYLDEIYRSGFPGIRNKSERIRKVLLKSYVTNIAEHEFEENGFKILNPHSLLAWMRIYAASIGTETKQSTLINAVTANDAIPSAPTVSKYREALEILDITDEVQPFLPMGKIYGNLAKGTKHFMLDPAIALSLLGVEKDELIDYQVPKYVSKFHQTLTGQLIESFVYQSLVVYADVNDAQLSYYRNSRGTREIDFILQKGHRLILFEVKTNPDVKDSYVRHLNWFEDEIGDEFKVTKVLLNTGRYAYTRREDHVHVIPLALLGA
ncbi:ATP-binding protein [Ligilactobacillus aviarius]|uniref:ATP-binding protein n=1 Tax=Ligilactobacillus aviarius TaxID=1606 RepID=UPI003890305A